MNYQIKITSAIEEVKKLLTSATIGGSTLKAPIYTDEKIIEIWLDAAHGVDVPGKRSPDGKHLEYQWSRMMIGKLIPLLEKRGFKVYQSNPTDKEIGLTKRTQVVTSAPGKFKTFLSIHNDAAPSANNGWENATGISFYTAPGLNASDIFAECLLYASQMVKFPETYHRKNIRKDSTNLEANFAVIKPITYWSCLAEILFQNNKKDVERLADPNFQADCLEMFIIGFEMFNTWVYNTFKK